MPEREAGETLEDWREQFEALFSNLPIGISYLTPDMRYIRINPFLEERLGVKSHEIAGRHCYDVTGIYKDDPNRKGEERICDFCGVKNALDTGKPFKFTRKVREDFIVENIGVPLNGKNGVIIGAVEIVVDVTDRIRLEEKLQEQASSLEKAVEEKTKEQEEFTAMLTHDLKTPLTSILGYSSIILSGELGLVPEKHMQPMEGILINAQRMLGLVRNILSMGRIKERILELDRSPVKIQSLITEAIRNMAPQINDKGHTTSIEFEPNLPPVLADKEHLERVLCNLITNAVKFTPHGGRISFAARKADEFVEIRLTDSGMGILPEEVPMLFDKYYKGAGSSSRGSGLGLFISKTIIDAHGGAIAVESRAGEGATFILSLPAAN
ncbi:MAG: PAS domain-containing sensor histidine kinase [Nitrospirota bacterium]